ncbi:glycosyltransferase family 2 protein [Acinetobacter indicus]|uniref:glycosyltransferase family 2 protein n=1 Tax=Acinetobacter indicus TaxID=756892 RepID=UPI002578D0AC|nr:glycosyltransferase family 2 protein [Acinetobacter indicus]MDM1269000.1 glycosyltransferase family 2 protein [Acinetobacter indicus]
MSIIIPFYNCEGYISETLESLLNQYTNEVEVILINDGSNDNSLNIVNNFIKHSKVNVSIVTQKNAGVSSARNLGIKLASGQYIGFLDSDDTLEPLYFEKIIQAIKKNEPDIVQFNFNYWGSNKYKSGINLHNGVYENSSNLLLEVFNWNSWYPWSRVYKREIFSDISFPLGFTFEDPAVVPFLFIKSKKILILDEYLYNYRENLSSITRGKDKEKIYKNMLSLENLLTIYCKQENDLFKICFVHFFRIYLDYCFLVDGLLGLKRGWSKYKAYYFEIAEKDKYLIKSKAGKLFISVKYLSYFSYFVMKVASNTMNFLKRI